MSSKRRTKSKRSGRRTRYEGRKDQCGELPPEKWGRTAPCARRDEEASMGKALMQFTAAELGAVLIKHLEDQGADLDLPIGLSPPPLVTGVDHDVTRDTFTIVFQSPSLPGRGRQGDEYPSLKRPR